ncbi:MAG: hypothetical protein WBD40_09695 [Tepidisphaeraceae bacterium]
MSVEEAVKIAMDYVRKLFDAGREFRLEEVRKEDDGAWEITISFRQPDNTGNVAMFGKAALIDVVGQKAAIGVDPSRVYKEVAIDKDGQVKSVRMRSIVVG